MWTCCNYLVVNNVLYNLIFMSSLFQVCPSMASLLPTTVMLSCGILVRVILVLCSVQLTALPAVQVHLAELGSGSTLMEGWFP